jgi:hypothetical protein
MSAMSAESCASGVEIGDVEAEGEEGDEGSGMVFS